MTTSSDLIENADYLLSQMIKVRQLAKAASFGFDLPLDKFLKLMYLYFPPQAYGKRIESYLIEKCLNAKRISSSDDSGDAIDGSGEMFEIKTSFSNPATGTLHIDQIRPHQNVAYYYFLAVDVLDDFRIYQFKIPKADMLSLNDQHGCHAHGVKKHVNQTSEYKIIINLSSEVWAKLLRYQIN